MMSIRFDTDNAAFTDDEEFGDSAMIAEVSRILRKIAAQVEAGHAFGAIHDVNGNKIGEWSL